MMLALALLLASPIHLEPDSGLFANTVYHVICLAEQISCSADKFEAFWREELGWSDEDDKALDAVSSTLNRLEDASPDPQPAPVPPNFPGYYPGYRARYALLGSILESGSVSTVVEAAEDTLPPGDAKRLAEAFAHFEARLRPWWEAQDPGRATEYSLEVIARMEGAELGGLANQLGGFLESSLDRAGLHAIVAPYGGKGGRATPMEAHVFIEYLPNDTTTDGAWKTLHELVHILYDNGPLRHHQGLVEQFLEAEQAHSMAHYVLLNEAIATASQLIAFERLGVEIDDFYSDPFVPRIARSTEPLLRAALAEGSTLYSGFAEQYMRAADAELDDEVRTPQYMLLGVSLFGAERHPDAAEAYLELIPPRSFATPDESDEALDEFPEVNVVRLLTHGELGSETELFPADSSDTRRRGFVYSPPPTSKKRVYLISGKSEEDLVEAVRNFAELNDVTHSGFLLTLE